MVKKLSKKDLQNIKNIKVVIPDDKEEVEPEALLNEERKDLTEEIEEEDLENIITNDPHNTLNTSTLRRFRQREANPSLEQEDINLEQSIADIPARRANEDTTGNANNPQNAYVSFSNTNDQNNLYSTNLSNPYNSNDQNAYQSIAGMNTNITSIEQQRLNQTSINAPQRFIPQQDTEYPKIEDPWGFGNQNKNITTIDEAKKKEKERKHFQ